MVTLDDVFNEVQHLEYSISRQDASSSEIKMLESGEIRIHSEDYGSAYKLRIFLPL